MADPSRKGWIVQIIISIITSMAVLVGAWFTLQGNIASSDAVAEASRLESAFRRISYLETEMKEAQVRSNEKIVELTTQIFRLQLQLNQDLDVLDMFENFMDSLPFEAWLKRVDYVDGVPTFTMVLINKKYEYAFGVSRKRYEGATDEEIWGVELARIFRESDLKALALKSSEVTYETFPKKPKVPNSPLVTKMVVKIYLDLFDTKPMIFGMAVDTPPPPEKK